MKIYNPSSILTAPVLSLALLLAATDVSIAQNETTTTTGQNEQRTTPEAATESSQTQAPRENTPESGIDRSTDGVIPDTDCVDINAGAAPNGDVAQGGATTGAPDINANVASDRDDCLDLLTNPTGTSGQDGQDDPGVAAEGAGNGQGAAGGNARQE